MTMTDLTNNIKNIVQGLADSFVLKSIPSVLISTVGFLFGTNSEPILTALFVLIVIDFITGISAAYSSKEAIRSKKVVRSAFKVVAYGALVSAGHLAEVIVPGNLYIQDAVVSFLAITELISIIENIGKLGFAIPKKLLNQLHKLRDEDIVEKENTSVKVVHDSTTGVTETHTVTEKVAETHVVEKPINPPPNEL